MNKIITANYISDEGMQNSIDTVQLPKKCPCCEIAYGNEPLITYKRQRPGYDEHYYLYSIYFCPHCGHCFFVKALSHRGTHDGAVIITQYPSIETCTKFSDGISRLSPQFVDIYHQAESAENHNLSEICGLGYRKSLEFLIKDYLIMLFPEKAGEIQNKNLGKCINDHVENSRIKSLAKASAWLGNDETHYIRKHPDYNLSDLKTFINATVAFIDSELAFLEAEKLLSTQ